MTPPLRTARMAARSVLLDSTAGAPRLNRTNMCAGWVLSNFLKLTQVAALIVSAATTSCGGDSNPEAGSTSVTLAPAPGGDRVLFIGNSLTEGNDLPLMVEALARAGGRPLAVEAVTYGGAALEDHWSRGTQDRIASGFRF